jgi:epoxyqueuosine reductase
VKTAIMDREKVAKNPNQFLKTAIKKYVSGNPENRLPRYHNEPLAEPPLVGFANGYDPIFHEFKEGAVIGDFHFTPEEALLNYLRRQHKKIKNKRPTSISVISIVFTATHETRLSNHRESVMASPRWQYAFGRGMMLMQNTLEYLVSLLESAGYQAVAPMNTNPAFFLWQIPGGPSSDWSEKHIAYAAGLGTFGLNSGLITPRGAALHCGSIITDLPTTPTPRAYDNHLANCLYYRNGSCQRCIKRCPSGALSKQGYDSIKCFFYHEVELPKICRDLGREPAGGGHPVCSLCQTKVPCENRIPPACKCFLMEKLLQMDRL